VKDKVTLVTDVEIAYYVVMKSHGALWKAIYIKNIIFFIYYWYYIKKFEL
jgi:hypothetical protein